MSRQCELTGKKPLTGNHRSHAENKTKRRFRPNLVNVTLISEKLDRKVKLRVSTHGLRSVEHIGGLDAFLIKSSNTHLSDRCKKLKQEILKTLL